MIELRLEVFNELFIQHGSGKSNFNQSNNIKKNYN